MSTDRIESWLRTWHDWVHNNDPRVGLVVMGVVVVSLALYFVAVYGPRIAIYVLRAVLFGLAVAVDWTRTQIERSCRGCRDRERRAIEIREAQLKTQETLLQASMEAILTAHAAAAQHISDEHATRLCGGG